MTPDGIFFGIFFSINGIDSRSLKHRLKVVCRGENWPEVHLAQPKHHQFPLHRKVEVGSKYFLCKDNDEHLLIFALSCFGFVLLN